MKTQAAYAQLRSLAGGITLIDVAGIFAALVVVGLPNLAAGALFGLALGALSVSLAVALILVEIKLLSLWRRKRLATKP